MLASVAAAALLLAACGNGDESDGNGVQELDPPEQSGDEIGADGDQDVDVAPDVSDDLGDGHDAEGNDESEGESDVANSSVGTSEAENPFAVPDEIDVDYVQSVFDELMRIDSELLQSVLERDLPAEVEDRDMATVDAIYQGPMHGREDQNLFDRLGFEDSREGFLDDVGEHTFEVLELAEVSDECLTAVGWWDLTEVSENPYSEDLHFAWVIKRDDEIDESINPTGWVIWDQNSMTSAEEEPIPQEYWDEVNFDSVLDVECGE